MQPPKLGRSTFLKDNTLSAASHGKFPREAYDKDAELQIGDFSNRSINPTGLVDIAAPGVDIYSSWPMPARYRTLSGTSMATPHVAGIAALLFEKFPDATPERIENELRKNARPLPLPAEDVGEGLSIAPE